MSKFSHESVLLAETIKKLAPQPSESALDCTLGLGGHAAEVLQKIGKNGKFYAIDADKENLEQAQEFLQQYDAEQLFFHANFIQLPELNIPPVDIILADLGMSSPHIDDPSRGFTYQKDVDVDLRYNRTAGQTAAEYIAMAPEANIADVFFHYGEIRQSRKLARLCKEHLPKTSGQIIELLEKHFGYKGRDLLPQIFQALRIHVNRELDALRALLECGPKLLQPGGRLAIISFHSLEDRLVKQAFRKLCQPQINDTTGQIEIEAEYILLTKKPIMPSELEVTANPRARSAKLRVLQKQL